MPQFYFDVYDGVASVDENGIDLPNLDVAKREAGLALGDLAKEFMRRDCAEGRVAVRIRDENGPILELAATVETRPLK